MTPFERSRKALEGVNIRKVLEESNLPVEIATAIADLCARPEAEWKSIETAPKDGTEILVYRRGIMTQARWGTNILGQECWGLNSIHFPEWDQPTHWMSLPCGPQSRSAKCYQDPRTDSLDAAEGEGSK